jgi:hypothetical protein
MEVIWPLLKASFGFAVAVVGVRLFTFISRLWEIRDRVRRLEIAGKVSSHE